MEMVFVFDSEKTDIHHKWRHSRFKSEKCLAQCDKCSQYARDIQDGRMMVQPAIC